MVALYAIHELSIIAVAPSTWVPCVGSLLLPGPDMDISGTELYVFLVVVGDNEPFYRRMELVTR